MHSLEDVVVIFDLDGTFADTAADLGAAMNHVLVGAGRPRAPVSRVRHLIGHGARAMLRKGFLDAGDALDDGALDSHVEAFLAYYLDNIAEGSRPFAFVLDAIAELQAKGARFAICTNKREAPARLLLRTLGVDHLFSAIVGMDTTVAAKPDARPLRRCMEVAGRGEAIMIGDSDTDIAAAMSAGIPSLTYSGGYGTLKLLGRSDGFFGDYRVLPMLIDRVLG